MERKSALLQLKNLFLASLIAIGTSSVALSDVRVNSCLSIYVAPSIQSDIQYVKQLKHLLPPLKPVREELALVIKSDALYPRVKKLFDRSISKSWQIYFKNKWRLFDRIRQSQINWNDLLLSVQKNQYDQEVYNVYQVHRLGASSTISRQSNINKLALEKWLAADRLIHEWATNKESITLEKILKLNETLDVENAQQVNPLVSINPMFLFNPFLPKTVKGSAGNLRDGDVFVANSPYKKMYIDHMDIPQALNDFFNWLSKAEQTMHPIELAAHAYHRLVSIHPFKNGNGRTARMVMDWILIKNNFPPTLPIHESAKAQTIAVFGRMSDNENVRLESVLSDVTSSVARGLKLLSYAGKNTWGGFWDIFDPRQPLTWTPPY